MCVCVKQRETECTRCLGPVCAAVINERACLHEPETHFNTNFGGKEEQI